MCDNCDNIILRDFFYSPKDYLNCIDYIKELLDAKRFELVEKSCEIDEIKDENGIWIDDVIGHVIRCNICGKKFSCSVNTYRGGGSFRKGR